MQQTLARASLVLLLILAFVLLMPLLGFGQAPAWVVIALLLVRLGLRLYAASLSGNLRSVALEAVITVLVAYLILSGPRP